MQRMTTWLVSGIHTAPGTRLWSVAKHVTDGVQNSCQSRPESVTLRKTCLQGSHMSSSLDFMGVPPFSYLIRMVYSAWSVCTDNGIYVEHLLSFCESCIFVHVRQSACLTERNKNPGLLCPGSGQFPWWTLFYTYYTSLLEELSSCVNPWLPLDFVHVLFPLLILLDVLSL